MSKEEKEEKEIIVEIRFHLPSFLGGCGWGMLAGWLLWGVLFPVQTVRPEPTIHEAPQTYNQNHWREYNQQRVNNENNQVWKRICVEPQNWSPTKQRCV